MHIPDGYLSPQTWLPLTAVAVPFLAVASRKVSAAMKSRQVPFLGLAAAFSFVIMMFNIPMPGGASGHAVGSVVSAILLGPWAACVATSIALAIQALMFGDGGITAFGANCLTMAVVMPFTGWFVYRLAAGRCPSPRRQMFGAALAGYVGLNLAALHTAFLFGIQPLIATGSDGRPLYAPYPLSVAVPAMAAGHLLLFGVVEGVVTALVIAALRRSEPALLAIPGRGAETSGGVMAWLRGGLAILALLSPLGLILPEVVGSGPAWGEWGSGELASKLGYLPAGMERAARTWRALLPDYSLPGVFGAGLLPASISYAISACFGIGLALLCVRLWCRLSAQQAK